MELTFRAEVYTTRTIFLYEVPVMRTAGKHNFSSSNTRRRCMAANFAGQSTSFFAIKSACATISSLPILSNLLPLIAILPAIIILVSLIIL